MAQEQKRNDPAVGTLIFGASSDLRSSGVHEETGKTWAVYDREITAFEFKGRDSKGEPILAHRGTFKAADAAVAERAFSNPSAASLIQMLKDNPNARAILADALKAAGAKGYKSAAVKSAAVKTPPTIVGLG